MNQEPVQPMRSYGQKPDSLTSGFDFGFQGQHKTPAPDTHRRRLAVFLRKEANGHKLKIGSITLDGNHQQEDAEMGGVQAAIEAGWIPDDPRVARFLSQYPAKVPNLGALQLQRENPLQIPWLGGLAVIPGDAEGI